MITKKIKLSLNKSTIANLNNGDMKKVQGGISEAGITIPPCTDGCLTDGCGGGTIDCLSVPAEITCQSCVIICKF